MVSVKKIDTNEYKPIREFNAETLVINTSGRFILVLKHFIIDGHEHQHYGVYLDNAEFVTGHEAVKKLTYPIELSNV